MELVGGTLEGEVERRAVAGGVVGCLAVGGERRPPVLDGGGGLGVESFEGGGGVGGELDGFGVVDRDELVPGEGAGGVLSPVVVEVHGDGGGGVVDVEDVADVVPVDRTHPSTLGDMAAEVHGGAVVAGGGGAVGKPGGRFDRSGVADKGDEFGGGAGAGEVVDDGGVGVGDGDEGFGGRGGESGDQVVFGGVVGVGGRGMPGLWRSSSSMVWATVA